MPHWCTNYGDFTRVSVCRHAREISGHPSILFLPSHVRFHVRTYTNTPARCLIVRFVTECTRFCIFPCAIPSSRTCSEIVKSVLSTRAPSLAFLLLRMVLFQHDFFLLSHPLLIGILIVFPRVFELRGVLCGVIVIHVVS